VGVRLPVDSGWVDVGVEVGLLVDNGLVVVEVDVCSAEQAVISDKNTSTTISKLKSIIFFIF